MSPALRVPLAPSEVLNILLISDGGCPACKTADGLPARRGARKLPSVNQLYNI